MISCHGMRTKRVHFGFESQSFNAAFCAWQVKVLMGLFTRLETGEPRSLWPSKSYHYVKGYDNCNNCYDQMLETMLVWLKYTNPFLHAGGRI